MRFEPHEIECYFLRPGDIVMREGGEPGRCALWKGQRDLMMFQKALRRIQLLEESEGWLCGTGCLRLRPDSKIVSARYLYDPLGAPDTQGNIVNRVKGSTMPNLSAGALKTVPILLPPMPVQSSYANAVEAFMRMIETLEAQNQKLAQARELLLPRLMSGEIAV